MTWFDQLSRVRHPDGRELIGASFRGVPFFVDASLLNGGRRVSSHEFIDSNLPKIDDLGKLANVFQVEGYVLGDEYMRQRNALLSALQDIAGPGELVHPFYGRRRAQCGPVSIRETKADGGIATFSIEFHNAPVRAATVATVDLGAVVRTDADALLVANRADLVETLVVSGQPAFALESLSDELSDVSASMKENLSEVVTVTQELALMSVAIDTIAAQTTSLIRTPGDMLDDLLGAVQQLEESLEGATRGIIEALLDSYDVPSIDAALGDTDTRVQERANQSAMSDALRIVLIGQASRMLPDVTFDSIGDAKTLRDRVVAAIDTLKDSAGNTTYPTLVNLRSSLLRAVPGDSALARVLALERAVETSSLVLSYELYGSVDSADDIVARNGVSHPGFIAGTIEVLSDV